MTAEEAIETLRRKERNRKCMSWKLCKEVANVLEELTKEKREEEHRKKKLRCPFCGGLLSEDRGGYRQCFSCHFEFDVESN